MFSIFYLKKNFLGLELIEKYFQNVKQGPNYICYSCGGLWFKHSVRRITVNLIQKPIFQKLSLLNLPHENDKVKFLCNTCYNSIRINKIPTLCLINGLTLPEIPEVLKNLTKMEERLISPRIPFLQIKELGEILLL